MCFFGVFFRFADTMNVFDKKESESDRTVLLTLFLSDNALPFFPYTAIEFLCIASRTVNLNLII